MPQSERSEASIVWPVCPRVHLCVRGAYSKTIQGATMAKFSHVETVFQFPWQQVVEGFFLRYPNQFSKHVLSEDTISREVKDGKLHTKRLLTKTNRLPKWGEKFINMKNVNIVEESVIDLQTGTVTTYTRNINHTKVMNVTEKAVYQANSDNSNYTTISRDAWVESHVYGVSYAIQAFGMERYRKNAQRALQGYSAILRQLSPDSVEGLESGSSLEGRRERFKGAARETAKKATELAKSKAGPIYAACAQEM